MKVALLGDISLIGRYDRTASKQVDSRLKEVRKITENCDFVIANLEAPLTSCTKTSVCKGVYLRSNPANVQTLLNLGVTHVTVGNNHIFDFGIKGKEETIKTLEEQHISYVGLNQGPVILEKENDRAMLEGFCCLSANGVSYGSKPGELCRLDEPSATAFLLKAKEQSCLPILSAHFGEEGVHYPSLEHRTFFRCLSESIPYVLHGNHPHAVQGVEAYHGSLLVYSHGNLCFDQLTDTSIKDLVVRQTEKERESLVIVLDIQGSKLIRYDIFAFSDSENGQQRNLELEGRVKDYSEALSLSPEQYINIRREAMVKRQSASQKRGLSFILRRLNRRYIGAYLAGRAHAREYRKVYSNYMTEEKTR